jgi:hypothetical protein
MSTQILIPDRSPRIGFSLLLGLLMLVAAGKVILADTMDPDCFWHLRVGEEIIQQGWPRPLVDDLSFASIRKPWTPYSWLAEVGMKKLWDAGGYRAAVAVQAIMESGFILLLGLGALETSRVAHGQPRYVAAILAAAVGGFLSLAYLSFRPVTAALVLLALIAWLLLRDRRMDQRSKSVWIVPPLTAVLINVHFFAIFVPLWTAALLCGDLLDLKSIRQPRLARGAILFLASSLACCMTPLLGGTIRSILDYSANDVMVRSGSIAEFRPFYLGTVGMISAALVGVLLLSVIWQFIGSRRRNSKPALSLGEIFWLLGSAALLLRMGRFAPIFAIIAAPALAAILPRLSDRILAKPAMIAALTVVLLMSAWPIAQGFPRSSQSFSTWLNRNGPDAPNYPCAAAQFVDQRVTPQTHHLICELTWGGYLEWRLGDHFQTLMDGRTQLFSADFWNATALASKGQRSKFLAGTPADVAIVRANKSPFGDILAEQGWKTVYQDDFARVLIPARAYDSDRAAFAN